MSQRGKFIVLEGIDGAGKSTHLEWLVRTLREEGRTVVSTREPGGTALGEKLRGLLLHEAMDADTEVLLMFAARREHVAQVIEPALARGDWVVSDRFSDASFAYQGGGRGLDWARLEALEAWVLGDLHPDLVLYFDLDVETSRQRLAGTGQAPDRFEQEQQDFFERVRSAYRRRVDGAPGRYVRVDARQSVESIRALLDHELTQRGLIHGR